MLLFCIFMKKGATAGHLNIWLTNHTIGLFVNSEEEEKMKTARWILVLLLVTVSTGLVGFSGDHHKVSDLQIETISLERLKADGRVNADKITVKSENHVVTLAGSVPTLEEKFSAERIVGSTIVGVTLIINQIQVVSLPVPDAQLTRQVNAELKKAAGLKGANIKAEVKNGIVRLSGDVQRVSQRELAGRLASSMTGVRDVVATLKVAGSEKLPDAVITKEVIAYLEWSPFVDPEHIKVSVKDGVVQLKGQVDHLVHLRTLLEDIANLRGVASVASELEVKR